MKRVKRNIFYLYAQLMRNDEMIYATHMHYFLLHIKTLFGES